jgi:hypothetical protein
LMSISGLIHSIPSLSSPITIQAERGDFSVSNFAARI